MHHSSSDRLLISKSIVCILQHMLVHFCHPASCFVCLWSQLRNSLANGPLSSFGLIILCTSRVLLLVSPSGLVYFFGLSRRFLSHPQLCNKSFGNILRFTITMTSADHKDPLLKAASVATLEPARESQAGVSSVSSESGSHISPLVVDDDTFV